MIPQPCCFSTGYVSQASSPGCGAFGEPHDAGGEAGEEGEHVDAEVGQGAQIGRLTLRPRRRRRNFTMGLRQRLSHHLTCLSFLGGRDQDDEYTRLRNVWKFGPWAKGHGRKLFITVHFGSLQSAALVSFSGHGNIHPGLKLSDPRSLFPRWTTNKSGKLDWTSGDGLVGRLTARELRLARSCAELREEKYLSAAKLQLRST